MAEVDFTNARIEPFTGTIDTRTNVNPTRQDLVSINNPTSLADAYGNSITTNHSTTRLVNEQKQLMYLYQGTFTASGTAFYILHLPSGSEICGWKVSNISFNSGDTYVFQINATLVCN